MNLYTRRPGRHKKTKQNIPILLLKVTTTPVRIILGTKRVVCESFISLFNLSIMGRGEWSVIRRGTEKRISYLVPGFDGDTRGRRDDLQWGGHGSRHMESTILC